MAPVEELLADLTHGARWLRRRKRFALLSTLIIAIGIGGATAIFSVADAVVLRPLPYATADRLFVIFEHDRSRGIRGPTSYPAFVDWRNGSRSFDAFAATTAEPLEVTLTGSGDPDVIAAAAVSGDFFQLLGVPPLVGRSLLPDDDRPGGAVAVLSDALWRERFAGDPNVVGRTLVLQGQPHTVVGVMPSQFAFPTGADVWLPMRAEEPLLLAAVADGLFQDAGAGVGWLTVIGRLREGGSIEAARDELSGMWRRTYRRSLTGADTSAVEPGVIDSFIENHAAAPVGVADVILGAVRPNVLAVLAGGLLVLVIASTNMAGLLLALAIERKRDFSIREALGASRARLIRAALTETLLLAMIGTAAGLLLAWWATPILSSLMPAEIPRADQIALNLRVIGFAGLAMTLVAVVAAVSPMALVRRGALEEVIRRASGRIVDGRGRMRAALVVAQVALAVVLLAGAGLMLRTFVNLRGVSLGFQIESILTVELAPRGERYATPEPRRRFYEDLLARVRTIPGVDAAAFVTRHPLWSREGYDWPFTIEGQPDNDAWRNPPMNLLAISADYFSTIGIRLSAGRAFAESDREGRPGVVIVSESFARRAWPGDTAIGKRLKMPLPDTPYSRQWMTVIGVAADARYRELERTRLDVYVSHLQAAIPLSSLMVRTRVDPVAVTSAVREATRSVDRDVPVVNATRMADVVSASLARRRLTAQLFAAFAIVALMLSMLGLYALLAHAVTTRTREIGIRLAIGARGADVRREIVRRGLGLTGTGVLAGLLAALAGGGVVESLLYGVTARDPIALAIAPLALVAAAGLACLPPALRATKVDPATVLREE